MKKNTFHFLVFLLAGAISFAQIKTPDKKPFNVGIFSGIGGLNFTPIPGVDLQYKGNILRLAPGYRVMGAGYIREILPLSEVFYNWYWIGSLYGAIGKEDNLLGATPGETITSTTYKGIVMTGAKVYFHRRWYSQIQGGVSYTQYKASGFPTDTELSPYFEFSLGINLFRNYLSEENFE
jgi:hypothetical protein